jgi:hypothetical protein
LSTEVPAEDGRAAYVGTRAGFYTLAAAGTESTFAANLADPAETAIGPRRELTVGSSAASAPEGFRPGVREEPWIWLLFAAIAIVTVEWFTWHRRVSV